jgi:hypothetical protein
MLASGNRKLLSSGFAMVSQTITLTGSALKLLLAATELSRKGPTFSAEELAVAAWESDRQAFGLKGFSELHPNYNKVLVLLMGSKGLIARGYLKKEAQKLYSVTEKGRKVVKVTPQEPETRLTREQERQLLHFLNSRALEKVVSGPVAELYFTDCLAFWGLTEVSSPDEIRARIAAQEELVQAVAQLLEEHDVTLSNGRVIRRGELGQIRRTAETIQVRFLRHLNMLLKGKKP